ncbi:adenylate/guanylate cyclase domain-containing protein [Hoeflea sp. TYP-13]|uniref:adenylate/guanylate cyclase domain-containing protein n=1 Tax=Hoeflea sp. TYP-13 TaxID=3230023 RepID=UPI0034C695F3
MRVFRGAGRVSLTILLSTAIATLILLSVGTVLFITAGANFRNTLELLQESGSLTMSNLETRLTDYVEPAEALAEYVVRLVDEGQIDLADKQQLRDTLLGSLGPSPQVSGVAIWDRERRPVVVLEDVDGTIQSIQSDTLPPQVENQLVLTEKTAPKTPTWTQPASIDGVTFINMQTALHKDGKYVGAFATGINVENLSKLVGEASGALGMTAFILYGDKHVLAHPRMEQLAKRSILDKELNLLFLRGFADRVLSEFPRRNTDLPPAPGDFENSIVEYNDQGYLFLTKEITGYGPQPWRIGVYANVQDVGDQFMRLLGSTAVAFLVLIVAIILGILLARYLARPIVQLSKAEAQVGDLDLENIEIPRASFIREINDQIRSFDRMLDGLRTFETYVPKALVRRIISQGGSGAVASTESNLALMFTDITGFTKMSEDMAPGEVAQLLNDHFAIVNKCIEAEGGTIDKYIGDAAMAFWGAPDAQADTAARACRAALAIQRTTEESGPDIRIKISIHSGPLIVGNIGAPGRINYTVVGDTVNTCSRIEDVCDSIDDGTARTIILVSDQIVAEVGAEFEFEPAGSFVVKGKSEPVKVFRLVGEKQAGGAGAVAAEAQTEPSGGSI